MRISEVVACVFVLVLATCSCSGDAASLGQPCDEEPVKPTLIYYQPAEYPEEALEQGIEGTVVVAVLITEDGQVGEARVLSHTPEVLNDSAIAAAVQCRFEPGRIDCKAVKSRMMLPYRFEIPHSNN